MRKIYLVVWMCVALFFPIRVQAALIKINAQNDVLGAYSNAVTDGNDGSYIGWIDTDSGSEGVYIQHFDTEGTELWAAGGQQVGNVYTDLTTHPDISYPEVELIADGSGGVIVAWADDRSGPADSTYNVYVQRYDSNGNAQWTTPPDPLDGVELSAVEGNFQSWLNGLQGRSDGMGGAWFSFFEGTGGDLYVQRLDASGVQQFGGGIDFGMNIATVGFFRSVVDTSGNLYLTFSGGGIVYTQKYDMSGSELWTPGGVTVGDGLGTRNVFGIAEDGSGGAMISYYQYNGAGDRDLYIQRFNNSGVAQLSGDGEVIHTYNTSAGSDSSLGFLNRDGSNYYITYESVDDSNNNPIFVQKLDADATQLWTTGGIEIGNNVEGYRDKYMGFPDGEGGMFAAILGPYNSTYTSNNIYVTHFDSDGTEWPTPKAMATDPSTWQFYFESVAAGEVIFVWPEQPGGAQAAYWSRISNVYQVSDLTDLDVQDSTDASFKSGTQYGVRGATVETTLIDTITSRAVSLIDVDMTDDRSWASVTAGIDVSERKAFVNNLTSAPGADTTHTLYIPYVSTDDSVMICPSATTLSEVSVDCVGGVEKFESDPDVTIETVDGNQVWAVSGLTGTGGAGVPGEEETVSSLTQGFFGSVSIDLMSPRDYGRDTQPTIKFKKAQLFEYAVSSYEVVLDPGKNRSFHVGGLPATHSNQAYSVWRDDAEVKVVYLNEHDADTSNDEIQVYFKALNSQPLTEGEHGWRVKVFNTNSQYQEYNQGFKIDLTSVTLPVWALQGAPESVLSTNYSLPVGTVPVIVGQTQDFFRGSNPTYAGGAQDSFTEVAAGLSQVSMRIKRLSVGIPGTFLAIYSDYDQSLFVPTTIGTQETPPRNKYTTMYLPGNKQLISGYYKFEILAVDAAGNERQVELLVTVGNGAVISPAEVDTTNGSDGSGVLHSELIGTITVPVSSSASDPAPTTDVVIVVVDEAGSPMVGVVVTLSGGRQAVTDERGEAHFVGLVLGTYTVEMTSNGQSTRQQIKIEPDMAKQSFTFAVSLQEPKFELPPLLPRLDTPLSVLGAYSSAVANVLIPVMGIGLLTISYGQGLSLKVVIRVLQALGVLAHGKPQGIVFNSQDSSTVPFALLTVKSAVSSRDQSDVSPITETIVSNAFGVYHGISLPRGSYSMTAAHQDFSFPAKKPLLSYLTHREYYRGEIFEVTSPKHQQFFLVPLDPRQVEKTLGNVIGQLRLLMSRLSLLNFGLPLMLFSFVVAVAYPSMLNWAIVTVYGLLVIRKLFDLFKSPTVQGRVVDAQGQPIKNVVIRLGAVDGSSFAALVTTDKHGHFKLFAPHDKFQINAFKPGMEWQRQGSPLGFEEVDARQGQVRLNLVMQPVVTA